MEKEKFRIILDLILIVLVILLLGFFIGFIKTVQDEGAMCVTNPINYYNLKHNTSLVCEVYNVGIPYLNVSYESHTPNTTLPRK